MKLSSVPLLASLLPSNSLAGKAQGFLRQNGAKAVQVTTDVIPCIAPEEFGSFDVTITEDATTFGDCRADFFKLLKEKMVAEGCSLKSNAANKELEYQKISEMRIPTDTLTLSVNMQETINPPKHSMTLQANRRVQSILSSFSTAAVI
mmetsp:Transcript_25370/g.45793  ORF Transcript_25370/g.45793 Transcript_25370/m.45793 type:complete len:148 (+) Transcript_25370:190-633(+)